MADTEKTGDKIPLTEADANAQTAEGEASPGAGTDVTPASTETQVKSEQGAEATSEQGAEATNEQGEMSKPKKKGGCSCGCVFRGLIFIITVPILLVLLAVAVVVWIILLPLKCLCPCIAPCLQCLADLVLWILHLPIRFLRWVAGKTEDDEKELIPEEERANYGTAEEKK